jgi:hypothetical protein
VNKIPHVILDGSAPENVEERKRLFDISEKRGVYPQVFIDEGTGGPPRFVGTFDEVMTMNECRDVDGSFAKAFAGVMEVVSTTASASAPIATDLPYGWTQRTAPDGAVYYVNSETKVCVCACACGA